MSDAQINSIVVEVLAKRGNANPLHINRVIAEVMGKYVPTNQLVYINSLKIEVLGKMSTHYLGVNRVIGEVLGKTV